MIYVTGVGPGSEAYLTWRAADVISGGHFNRRSAPSG